MHWYFYVAYFFGGAFLVNGIPQFVNGVSGRSWTLQFRADIFNLFNTPSLGQPFDFTNDSSGSRIIVPRSFQSLTPDARFFQLSLKYSF